MRGHLARVDTVLVQAAIAAALSFAHLHDLAAVAGQEGWKAWAYPISVDLLLVAAWRRLRSGSSRAAGWCWFLVALAASLGANVATAGLLDLAEVPAWLRILVAGWPAIAFLGGTLLAHGPTTPDYHGTPEQVEEHDTTTDTKPPVPAVPVSEPPAIAAKQGPISEPKPPAVQIPAALIDHARKIADAHQARTGTPIDTPTLRARLGVPAPLADAIATQLT